MTTDFNTYVSPLSWRYGSDEMRLLWSEVHKRRVWRRIWLILAQVQAEFDLLSHSQVSELRSHIDDIDMERALEIESIIKHDLMAEIAAFAEQCPQGGKIIHFGATSMDIKDNAEVIVIRESIDQVLKRLRNLLLQFAEKIDNTGNITLIGFTHLQPAEPSTLGYRFAQYAQDLLSDWELLTHIRSDMRGKGLKGAVGTSASFAELVGIENLEKFEKHISDALQLPFYDVTTQTYPRKQDYKVVCALAGLACSLHKFALDIRFLQSPPIGEVGEGFARKQVGSSAMPFKQNPIKSEKIDSLARAMAQLPRVAWDNAAHSMLERTMDDSANRRIILPEAFLITDEILKETSNVIKGLRVDENSIRNNMNIYGPFAAVERVLMGLTLAGADRQKMHECLRKHSIAAWKDIRDGQENPLKDLICSEDEFLEWLTLPELTKLMDASSYIGDATRKASAMAEKIRGTV